MVREVSQELRTRRSGGERDCQLLVMTSGSPAFMSESFSTMLTGDEETGSRISREREFTCNPHISTNRSRDSLSCINEKHLHTQIPIMIIPRGGVVTDGVSTPFYYRGDLRVPGKCERTKTGRFVSPFRHWEHWAAATRCTWLAVG